MEPASANDLVLVLLRSWPVIVFVSGVIFNAGATVYMVRSHNREIRELKVEDKSIRDDIKIRLYDNKSQPIYMPAEACLHCRLDCEKIRLKDFDYVAQALREHGEKLNCISKSSIQSAETIKNAVEQFKGFVSKAPPEHIHDETTGRVLR